MKKRGYAIINYIDNVIGFDTVSTANSAFQCQYRLLENLGFEISTTKLVAPTTNVTCLGVLINTEDFSVLVPPEKLRTSLSCAKKGHLKVIHQKTIAIFTFKNV